MLRERSRITIAMRASRAPWQRVIGHRRTASSPTQSRCAHHTSTRCQESRLQVIILRELISTGPECILPSREGRCRVFQRRKTLEKKVFPPREDACRCWRCWRCAGEVRGTSGGASRTKTALRVAATRAAAGPATGREAGSAAAVPTVPAAGQRPFRRGGRISRAVAAAGSRAVRQAKSRSCRRRTLTARAMSSCTLMGPTRAWTWEIVTSTSTLMRSAQSVLLAAVLLLPPPPMLL